MKGGAARESTAAGSGVISGLSASPARSSSQLNPGEGEFDVSSCLWGARASSDVGAVVNLNQQSGSLVSLFNDITTHMLRQGARRPSTSGD
ncbi:unnamed protein product [Arctogadus glacialis]